MGQVISQIWGILQDDDNNHNHNHNQVVFPNADALHVSVSKPGNIVPRLPCHMVHRVRSMNEEVVAKINKNVINKVGFGSKEALLIKKIGPYTSNQKLLLVGEGDFSFSACLAVALGSPSNILATSINSFGFLIKNYNMFLSNKMKIESRGGVVIHEINARTMVKDPLLGRVKFDRIIFNFPHAGSFGLTDADMRKHKNLVTEFLRNAKKMINEDGEIHIRHKCNGVFLKWDIPKLGYDQGLILIQEMKFDQTKYPGYHTKYGFGGDKDFECNPCKTYKFGLFYKYY
ncbi:hypothetical protein KSS87_014663 [Heliosperma pusillum]|nr:hypothetical protein KSS87_014663 [Heliosperma pusillum]